MAIWLQLGLQEGMSTIIELIIYFHDYMMIILCIIIAFVLYVFVLVLLRTLTDKYILDAHTLELIWTIVPIAFLLFMAFPSLYLLYITEDSTSPSSVLKVVGHQWYWEYEYSLGSKTYSFDSYIISSGDNFYRNLDVDNRVCIPTGRLTLALITSADVLHSWTVPSLGVKADATPGRLNFLNLSPSSSGVYYGQCSELCGSNHSFIPIVVESVHASSYVSFINSLS